MTDLSTIEQAAITAMKAGDRSRLDVLRLLINQIKNIAKSDKNRNPVADDVITAVNRMIKQARETRSYLMPDNGGITQVIDSLKADRVRAIDLEIQIVSEFLPQRMTRDELTSLIKSSMVDAPEGKAARGHVMKTLNGSYRGQFDAREASDILAEMLG